MVVGPEKLASLINTCTCCLTSFQQSIFSLSLWWICSSLDYSGHYNNVIINQALVWDVLHQIETPYTLLFIQLFNFSKITAILQLLNFG